MGGRGGSSGKYSGMSVDSLTRARDRYAEIMHRNRTATSLNKNSSSSAVRRKQRAAERAYTAAEKEIQQIDRAISIAKRRKKNVPF